MFGILTVQQEPKCGIRRRLALRLFPKRSLQVEEGLFRTAMFMQVRLVVCPWWKGNLQEKRVSLALRRLRERGIREAILPEEWCALARRWEITPVSAGALRESCALQAVAEACRGLGLPLSDICLQVWGKGISRPAAAQVLSLAKSVRTVRVTGDGNEALRNALWRSCGIADRGPMPENAPVIFLCLSGGKPEGECLMAVDLTETGGEGEGLWWRPRLLPPEGALSRLPEGVCPEALAAALLHFGAVQAREIRVSRLDIPEDTQYNKGIVDNSAKK